MKPSIYEVFDITTGETLFWTRFLSVAKNAQWYNERGERHFIDFEAYYRIGPDMVGEYSNAS